jgi:hypothetical protein
MDATVVDLRYHMKDVLKALDRNESVRILYHGKLKGTLTPAPNKKNRNPVQEHAFFASCQNEEPVEMVMSRLRAGRYDDL